jgi:hypothetical protein
VSFAAVTPCVASQRVFIVIVLVYFVIDSVRILLDILSYRLTFSNTNLVLMEIRFSKDKGAMAISTNDSYMYVCMYVTLLTRLQYLNKENILSFN